MEMESGANANHMREGRNAGGLAGQYATGWTLHSFPSFFCSLTPTKVEILDCREKRRERRMFCMSVVKGMPRGDLVTQLAAQATSSVAAPAA